MRRVYFGRLASILILGSVYVFGGAVSAQESTIPPCASRFSCLTFLHFAGRYKVYDVPASEWLKGKGEIYKRALLPVGKTIFQFLYHVWISKTSSYRKGVKKMIIQSPNGKRKVYLVRLDTSLQHQNASAHMDIYDLKGWPKGKLKVDSSGPIFRAVPDWNDKPSRRLNLRCCFTILVKGKL